MRWVKVRWINATLDMFINISELLGTPKIVLVSDMGYEAFSICLIEQSVGSRESECLTAFRRADLEDPKAAIFVYYGGILEANVKIALQMASCSSFGSWASIFESWS